MIEVTRSCANFNQLLQYRIAYKFIALGDLADDRESEDEEPLQSTKDDVIKSATGCTYYDAASENETSLTLRRHKSVPIDVNISTQTSAAPGQCSVNGDEDDSNNAINKHQSQMQKPSSQTNTLLTSFGVSTRCVDRAWTSSGGFPNNSDNANRFRLQQPYDYTRNYNVTGLSGGSNCACVKRQFSHLARQRSDDSSRIIEEFMTALRAEQRARRQLMAIQDSTARRRSVRPSPAENPRLGARIDVGQTVGGSPESRCDRSLPSSVTSCQSASSREMHRLRDLLQKERQRSAKLRAELVRLSILKQLEEEWAARLQSELSRYVATCSDRTTKRRIPFC